MLVTNLKVCVQRNFVSFEHSLNPFRCRRLLEDKIDARLVCLYGDGAPNVIPRESAADVS